METVSLRFPREWRGTCDRVLAGAAFIAAWSALAGGVGPRYVPPPSAVVARWVQEWSQPDYFTLHVGYTVSEAVLGFAIGLVPAALLPLAFRRLPGVLTLFDPVMVAAYGIPKLALAPLFIVWFGIGAASKIAVVAVSVFFIVYFNVRAGLRTIDVELVRLAQVMGATERDIVRRIVVPAVAPYFFAAVRTATPYSIGGAVVAELMSSNRGLGYMLQLHTSNFDTAGGLVVLGTIAALVGAANWCASVAETAAAPGRSSSKGVNGS